MKTTSKLPQDLQLGDVVQRHGARWLVIEVPQQTQHPMGPFGLTYATRTKYLGETTPGAYSGYESMKREGYDIQGNSHPAARVAVENGGHCDCCGKGALGSCDVCGLDNSPLHADGVCWKCRNPCEGM